jgi:hypothetical protein
MMKRMFGRRRTVLLPQNLGAAAARKDCVAGRLRGWTGAARRL